MKKVLIISPHFPPSNLAAVHRSRLFAQHLPAFGWEPIILTADEKYYEEALDHNLVKLLPEGLRIEKVKAYHVTKPRLIGDIGLRSFLQLLKKAVDLIKKEKIDFLYIPIPSFYVALIGRIAHAKTKVPYGIDYIDPWVHTFPGSNKLFSRHWWSTKIAGWLEPIAVKNAKVITGVAEGYYDGVLQRNPKLKQDALFAAMPYGGEAADYNMVSQLKIATYVFSMKANKIQLVYAGALLPKAIKPLRAICEAICKHPETFINLELYFIGTGTSSDVSEGCSISEIARDYGLWNTIIFEHPARIPYLDVIAHLSAASGVFILGSTEAHYTPSKVYQAVLAYKPIWAVLHLASTACEIIRSSTAGIVLDFNGEQDLPTISNKLANSYFEFVKYLAAYEPGKINTAYFDQYSAKKVTGVLASLLDKAIAT